MAGFISTDAGIHASVPQQAEAMAGALLLMLVVAMLASLGVSLGKLPARHSMTFAIAVMSVFSPFAFGNVSAKSSRGSCGTDADPAHGIA